MSAEELRHGLYRLTPIVDGGPHARAEGLVVILAAHALPVLSRAQAVHRGHAATGRIEQTAALQIAQHRAQVLFSVRLEADEQLTQRARGMTPHVVQDSFPERIALDALALAQALNLALVAAQRHAEHVGCDRAAHALSLDLPRQLEEDLIGDVRERRAQPRAGRELRDQNRGLTDDAVDQPRRVHASPPCDACAACLERTAFYHAPCEGQKMACRPGVARNRASLGRLGARPARLVARLNYLVKSISCVCHESSHAVPARCRSRPIYSGNGAVSLAAGPALAWDGARSKAARSSWLSVSAESSS